MTEFVMTFQRKLCTYASYLRFESEVVNHLFCLVWFLDIEPNYPIEHSGCAHVSCWADRVTHNWFWGRIVGCWF